MVYIVTVVLLNTSRHIPTSKHVFTFQQLKPFYGLILVCLSFVVVVGFFGFYGLSCTLIVCACVFETKITFHL